MQKGKRIVRRSICLATVAGWVVCCLLGGVAVADPVTVVFDQTFQEVDGFGAGVCFDEQVLLGMDDKVRAEALDRLFGELGATMLRLRIHPEFKPSETAPYDWDCMADQRAVVKEALRRGVVDTVWVSVWSPPAWMKDNASLTGGKLMPDKYKAYGKFIAEYVQGMRDQYDIDIAGVSLFNEPGNGKGTESNEVSAVEYPTILRAAVEECSRRGLQTQWIGPDTAAIRDAKTGALGGLYLEKICGDRSLHVLLEAAAVHQYEDRDDDSAWEDLRKYCSSNGKKIWQTETTNVDGAAIGIESGLETARRIWRAFALGGVSAWHYKDYFSRNDPKTALGLIDISGPGAYVMPKRYFAFKQWSEHVRPEMQRVYTSTNIPDFLVVAFKNEEKKRLVVLAINSSPNDAIAEFNCTSLSGSVRHVRTSDHENCANQPDIAPDRNTFKNRVKGRSINTYIASYDSRFGFWRLRDD